MRQCVENSESNMEMTYDYSVQKSTTAFQTRAKMKATVMQQDMATTAHASKDSKDQTVTVRICYIRTKPLFMTTSKSISLCFKRYALVHIGTK